jgi:ribosomal subunit interface protein
MVWDAEIAHDVVVQAHGEVTGTDRSYARMKIARIWQRAAAPVLFAKVELRRSPNPACDEPAEAKAELDVDGHVVRAEATAPTFFEAIDQLDTRLRRQLVRLADRDEVHHRRSRRSSREVARAHGQQRAGARVGERRRDTAERDARQSRTTVGAERDE